MVEQNINSQFCINGHKVPVSDSKFCSSCGVALHSPENKQANLPDVPQPAQAPPVAQAQNPNPHAQQDHRIGQQQGSPQALQQVSPAPGCRTCGGNGRGLDKKILVCKECCWLRPLAPGYAIDCSAFQWAEDGKAMSALRSISPLNSAAKTISQKVGRRWIESTFNGVLLGDNQMPHIYTQAVQAARILGMSYMPDIYLSGERPWDCVTYGTDTDSFVVLGSALAGNFRNREILFLLAREMGHCRAGHALWKTVSSFFLGEKGPRKGLMAGGVFAALSPSALVGGAIEVPLLAWARQAEVTADRAGLLAVGDEETARRVLLSWSLKSSFIYNQINVQAWIEQQELSEDDFSRLSELATSSTPYITRRLKLLTEFAASPDLKRWKTLINSYLETARPPGTSPKKQGQGRKDDLRIKCAACGAPLRIPLKVLEGKKELPVRCPSAKCGKITRLKKSAKPVTKAKSAKATQMERDVNYGDE